MALVALVAVAPAPAPLQVDQRSEYERRVIAKYKMRPNTETGKFEKFTLRNFKNSVENWFALTMNIVHIDT